MPYIGNEAAVRFVSKPAVDHFSGDGSTTAFTLSFPVASDQDILVSVDGVVQDTTAYAVSSGTTLTFTAAPSSNSGNNIFVNYLARVSATIAHPSTSALTATTGTFSGAFTSPGIDDNASATALNIDSNGQVGLTGSTTAFDTTGAVNGLQLYYESDSGISTIGPYSNGGNTSLSLHTNSGGGASAEAMNITSSGEVTKPLQPAFLAKPTSDQTNHALNGYVDVVFGTEVFDLGSNFASNTFTAPVTGKYQLNAGIYVQNLDEAAGYYIVTITTSNRTIFQILDPRSLDQDAVYWSLQVAVLADMDASDTAKVQVYQSAGTQQTDINANSYFSGFLAC